MLNKISTFSVEVSSLVGNPVNVYWPIKCIHLTVFQFIEILIYIVYTHVLKLFYFLLRSSGFKIPMLTLGIYLLKTFNFFPETDLDLIFDMRKVLLL